MKAFIFREDYLPTSYLGCTPELQELKITLEYYESLERDGYAQVCGHTVDDLSLNEVLAKFKFDYHFEKPYKTLKVAAYQIERKKPSLHANKKISLEQLSDAWQNYRQERSAKFFTSDMSKETQETYQAALNPMLCDEGRYLLLRRYVINKANKHRAFKKALERTFGDRYFCSYSNYDTSPHHAS